jgi:hypothetical protein
MTTSKPSKDSRIRTFYLVYITVAIAVASPCAGFCTEAHPIGIMAVPPDFFSAVKTLGVTTVHTIPLTAEALESALSAAKSQGLKLAGRVRGDSSFQDGERIDFDGLMQLMESTFSTKGVAGDTDFVFLYIIDEPCHPGKWDISLEEFKTFYKTVKSVDPSIPVFVNFGNLECLQNYVSADCSDCKIADFAGFTITVKKWKEPDFLAEANTIAGDVKRCDPSLKILPLIAVYEYPELGLPIPSADFVRETGLAVLQYDNFDGIFYFPWSPSWYMGDTIEDVVNEPVYVNAFREVFEAAIQKFATDQVAPDPPSGLRIQAAK